MTLEEARQVFDQVQFILSHHFSPHSLQICLYESLKKLKSSKHETWFQDSNLKLIWSQMIGFGQLNKFLNVFEINEHDQWIQMKSEPNWLHNEQEFKTYLDTFVSTSIDLLRIHCPLASSIQSFLSHAHKNDDRNIHKIFAACHFAMEKFNWPGIDLNRLKQQNRLFRMIIQVCQISTSSKSLSPQQGYVQRSTMIGNDVLARATLKLFFGSTKLFKCDMPSFSSAMHGHRISPDIVPSMYDGLVSQPLRRCFESNRGQDQTFINHLAMGFASSNQLVLLGESVGPNHQLVSSYHPIPALWNHGSESPQGYPNRALSVAFDFIQQAARALRFSEHVTEEHQNLFDRVYELLNPTDPTLADEEIFSKLSGGQKNQRLVLAVLVLLMLDKMNLVVSIMKSRPSLQFNNFQNWISGMNVWLRQFEIEIEEFQKVLIESLKPSNVNSHDHVGHEMALTMTRRKQEMYFQSDNRSRSVERRWVS
ncbi:hypothetical protein OIO90_004314 [Microbotryomycetes sp. JL221]|nr:hypothetical protein OIO90_004314 [Microbotryomycetes sp. JL221]